MVRGLDIFRATFGAWTDQYILIGGTAAFLAMEEASLPFRATKDLDVVLVVEALTADFGAAFWAFIQRGGYEVRQASTTTRRCFHRFQKPKDTAYPAMIELFARAPDALRSLTTGHLTPIPFDEELSSLSAILLDDAYYAFVVAGRRERNGLAWVDETRLIPLKAAAWLEMRERKARGEPIDADKIRKHALDILRLSQLITDRTTVPIEGRVRDDLRRFLAAARGDGALDPGALKINATLDAILSRLARAYGLT